eukprot:SAG31_NODE_12028_length_976_cov_0.985177_1_plen_201_part_00
MRSKRKQLQSVTEQIRQCCTADGEFRIFNCSEDDGILHSVSKQLGVAAKPDLCELSASAREEFSIESVFDMTRVVGKGAAGIVQEGRLKGSRDRSAFAIKIIAKDSAWWQGAPRRRAQTTVREVTILAETTRNGVKGVARAYSAIETEFNIYIVMECCQGGDLMQRLVRKDCAFSEERSAYILRSLVTVETPSIIGRSFS